ncbi:hypothetical protein JCM8208_003540 [Rhodotorula glutinis]
MAVLACGSNAFRQLADSDELVLPVAVQLPHAASLAAASWSQSLLRDSSGELRCLGHSLVGELPSSPVKRWLGHDELSAALGDGDDGIVTLLDGARIAGDVDETGLNGRGELLVVPNTEKRPRAAQGPQQWAPRLYASLASARQQPDDDGDVLSWHEASSSTADSTTSTRRDVRSIEAGTAHFLVLVGGGPSSSSSSEVWSFGDSRYGQAGPFPSPTLVDDPSSTSTSRYIRPSLRHIAFFDGLHPVQVSCGAFHSAVVTAHGAAYVFGSNKAGQLGFGEGEPGGAEPVLVELGEEESDAVEEDEIVQVACGAAHTVLLTESGHIWVTGANDDGQLGLGDTTSRWTWVRNVAVEEAVQRAGCRRVDRVVCSRATTYFECT